MGGGRSKRRYFWVMGNGHVSRIRQLRKDLACNYEYIVHLRIDKTDPTDCPASLDLCRTVFLTLGLPPKPHKHKYTALFWPETTLLRASRMFGPLGVSLAPYVRSSRTLYKWLKPLATWYTNVSGYRQMGFRYDDLSAVLCLPGFIDFLMSVHSRRRAPRCSESELLAQGVFSSGQHRDFHFRLLAV
jgi:hypothetical protein